MGLARCVLLCFDLLVTLLSQFVSVVRVIILVLLLMLSIQKDLCSFSCLKVCYNLLSHFSLDSTNFHTDCT